MELIYDETGKIIGMKRPNKEEIIAAKEAELLAMYNELERLKNNK